MFASTRNGGEGRFDLWMCVDSGNDDWGPAMNLGTNINTKLNELSPAFTAFQNDCLIGHPDMTGLNAVGIVIRSRVPLQESFFVQDGDHQSIDLVDI